MKRLFLLIPAALLFACNNSTDKSSDKATPSFEVKYFGALKDMMHKGDISAKADLSDLKTLDHVYALGALENLKGEIQIFDGQSFNTFVQDSAVQFDNTLDKKATLLVYASVPEWNSYPIPDEIKTYEQLETFIAETVKANNIDTERPFPFLMDGTPDSFSWHVINWPEGDTEHSHEKHVNSGLHGTQTDKEVELLGFYSNAHHAIFTHHTTNMHIHVKTKDGSLAGHLDGIELGAGMVLKLPK